MVGQYQINIRKALKYATIFIIILGILFTFANLRKLKQHFLNLDLAFLLLAIACTLIVYILEGFFTKLSLVIFDEKLPLLDSMKYSFIINSFGYILSLGGLTHFATQIYVLDHHNITPKKATLSRVLYLMFFNILFDLLIIAGFIALLLHKEKENLHLTLVIIVLTFFFILIISFYLAIFWKTFQDAASKVFTSLINMVLRLFTKKLRIEKDWARNFLKDFNDGFFKLIKRPGYFISMLIVTIIDWSFWLGVMYFCFLSVNYTIKLGFLIIGFSIGQIVGVLSMLPGGVGTLEGSMALVFTALGVPLERALGAIILFRITFYIVPFVLSLPFYFGLKKKLT
ncbi:MAG: flippase-like domain-containing protein [Spirochaetota bacterium]|nr:MAG: flippase-like domain-containing protein [Spirochaetota bacterium]